MAAATGLAPLFGSVQSGFGIVGVAAPAVTSAFHFTIAGSACAVEFTWTGSPPAQVSSMPSSTAP